MKILALSVLSFLFFASTIFGQVQSTERSQKREARREKAAELKPLKKLNAGAVSTEAKNSFRADYKDATNPVWERTEYFDEVAFTKDGKPYRAFYDFEGNLVGTTSMAQFSDLPSAAQKKIKSEYKDYKIENVIFFDDNEANESDMMLYGKQFSDEDNYFVEISKGSKKSVVQVDTDGNVYPYIEDLQSIRR